MSEAELTARITQALADPEYDTFVMNEALANQNAIDTENAAS